MRLFFASWLAIAAVMVALVQASIEQEPAWLEVAAVVLFCTMLVGLGMWIA